MIFAKLYSKLPWVVARSERRVGEIVEETCFRIENEAKSRSRWKTGNMRGGWQSQMTGKTEGVVYNLVEYAIFHEYGTRHMSAQPMLTPAVALEEPRLLAEVAEVYR